MTRLNKILVGLLAVQLVLAIVMLTRDRDGGVAAPAPVTAGLDPAKVTKVQVFAKREKGAAGKASEAKPDVELVKKGDAWVVASAYDFPVDAEKLTKLLTSVAGLTSRGPIASGAGRQVQLAVADDVYERKLVITTDKGERVFYVGAAAGGQRTAIRKGGDDRIHAVPSRELSAFSLDTEPRGWVQRVYLEAPKEEIASVAVKTAQHALELDQTGGSWVARNNGATLTLAAGESLDVAAIDAAVAKLARLELAAPADPARDASKPVAVITVRSKPPAADADAGAVSASVPERVLDVVADGDKYWVHERGNPRAVLVEKWALDSLVELTPAKLAKKPEPAGKGPAGAGVPRAMPGGGEMPPLPPGVQLPGPG